MQDLQNQERDRKREREKKKIITQLVCNIRTLVTRFKIVKPVRTVLMSG